MDPDLVDNRDHSVNNTLPHRTSFLIILTHCTGCYDVNHNPGVSLLLSPTQQTQNIWITFIQCWTNVEDVGPTLYKCHANVLYFLKCLIKDCIKVTCPPPPIISMWNVNWITFRPLGCERVYLPLHKVADTPFHTQKNDLLFSCKRSRLMKRGLFYSCHYLGTIYTHYTVL